MPESLRILFISAEVAPFAKTGGLGDVAGSLPKALKRLGHDVRVVMPAYQPIENSLDDGPFELESLPGQLLVPMGFGTVAAGVFEGRLPGSKVPVYFIAESNLFGRDRVYGYDDDPYRFAFFSRAALNLTEAIDWRPDIVHAHDWHTAPAVTWLATAGQGLDRFRGLPSVFTIHNLAHQGRTSWSIMDYLGIISHGLVEEPYGEVNFMARGIYHATMVNTVSPSYAQEIMTPEGGAGLDALLRHRAYDVHGILNGLDYDEWNPETDTRLATQFGPDKVENRLQNKRALQARSGLPQRDDVPLVAMITRLDFQKGLDISGHVIGTLLGGAAGDAQFIALGSGEAEYEQLLAQLAGAYPDKMTAFLDYLPELAPLIYGGSDIFVMPSRFEPCGLGQLIALRYGSIPVVRYTGGLADTIEHDVTGFTFGEYSGGAFWGALEYAVHSYRSDKERWSTIQQNGMAADYSWDRSALGYQQLYQWAKARMG